MAVKIQIKRGTKAGLPTLAPGEYGLATDTNELFVGTASGNVQIPVLGSDGKIPGGQLPSMDYLPTAGGTMTGAIAMGGNKITGLAAPTENADAARKQDVDDFEPQSSAVQLSAAAQAALGLGSGSTLDDAMEVLQQGETLFETTISQSGTQLNINVDTTNWGNYQYVFVIIDAALKRAGDHMRVRLNNSTSEDQSCCYFRADFYEPSGDRKFVAVTGSASANSERAVLCFNVFGNRANNIVCHMKSTTAYSWGTFDGLRYSQLTQINLVCTSSGSSIQSGAHIKIVGVK